MGKAYTKLLAEDYLNKSLGILQVNIISMSIVLKDNIPVAEIVYRKQMISEVFDGMDKFNEKVEVDILDLLSFTYLRNQK